MPNIGLNAVAAVHRRNTGWSRPPTSNSALGASTSKPALMT
jgi:hypothetical protein